MQRPIVGLLSYQQNLESSDKHCIGQSPNCDPGMFTSSHDPGMFTSSQAF